MIRVLSLRRREPQPAERLRGYMVRAEKRFGVEWEVLEVRPSSTKPDRGTARLGITTRNQRGEIVLSLVTTILLPRRPVAP